MASNGGLIFHQLRLSLEGALLELTVKHEGTETMWCTVTRVSSIQATASLIMLAALAIVLGGETALAQQQCAVVIDGMEITQVVQFYEDSEPDNSMPLIDGKATAVRVYLRLTPPGCSRPLGAKVVGHLSAFAGYLPFFPVLTSVTTDGAVIPPSGKSERIIEDSTLNFTLGVAVEDTPAGGPEGGAPVWFRASVCSHLVGEGGTCSEWGAPVSETVDFQKGCGLDLAAVPLDIQFDGRGEPDNVNKIESYGANMIWAAHPMPEPGKRARYTYYRQPLLVEHNITTIEGKNKTVEALLTRRAIGDPPGDHLYGWMDGSCAGSSGYCWGWSSAAVGTLGTAFGTDEDARLHRTHAHELTHYYFGAEHQKVNLRVVGWDVLDRTMAPTKIGRVKDPNGGPVGFYRGIRDTGPQTDYTWTTESVNEYPALVDALAGFGCDDIPDRIYLPIRPWMMVRASESAGGEWAIDPAYDMHGRIDTDPGGGAGDLELRISNSSGTELFNKMYDTTVLTQTTGIWVATPVFTDSHRIEVLRDGIVQADRIRSTHAPTVTISSPSSGSVITDTTSIVWQTGDADGDSLHAIVQYSHDAGNQWWPLGWDLQTGSVELDVSEVAAAEAAAGRIRVIVTDGFNTSVAEIDSLSVGSNNPPVVTLRSPAEGDAYPSGANVTLIADALDPEDWHVPDEQIAWSSSIDGPLGLGRILNTGSGLQPNLSSGQHVISAQATDSLGAVGSSSVAITIQ